MVTEAVGCDEPAYEKLYFTDKNVTHAQQNLTENRSIDPYTQKLAKCLYARGFYAAWARLRVVPASQATQSRRSAVTMGRRNRFLIAISGMSP